MSSSDDPALSVLRPALELALAVARLGAAGTPPVPPPGPVRPLLRFSKLSERALATLRDSVEDDGEFRRRVAEQADEADIGRLPFIWLTRGEGWAEELEAAERQRSEAATEMAGKREERSARRRLVAVEAALARAETDAVEARRAAAETADELVAQRQERRRVEQEARKLDEAAATMTQAVEEMERALVEATTARRQLEDLLDDAHRRIDALIAERDDALDRGERAEAATVDALAGLSAGQQRADDVRSSLGRAVGDAAGAAQLLGAALAAAAQALGSAGQGEPRPGADDPDSSPPARPELTTKASPVAARLISVEPHRRRQPVPLPPAIFDDSPEAAGYLSRVAGMVMVVDGYNVSLSGWAREDLAVQRRYLINRLAGLAARTGVSVRVIFDGADQHHLPPPPGAPRDAVRVAFSPAGVDADEVIIDLVQELSATTPVMVATSDRRVADEVARRGANVISTPQLLALLGRPLSG